MTDRNRRATRLNQHLSVEVYEGIVAGSSQRPNVF